MNDDIDEETTDEALLSLIDKGLLSFSYDPERDDWVFMLKENVVILPDGSVDVKS